MKSKRSFRFLLASRVLLAVLILSGAAAPRLYAKEFRVNTQPNAQGIHPDTLAEHDANAGDGVCADHNGKCSLRAAIEEINASRDVDEVGIIDLIDGKYTLTQGQLEIKRNLYLYGVASGSTISGNNQKRVFFISNSETNPALFMDRVVIENGIAIVVLDNRGGGIWIRPGCSLSLSNSVVRNNQSNEHGAGIYNEGYLTLVNSSVENNQVIGQNNAFGATNAGGGISNILDAFVEIINSTISGNIAQRGGGISNGGRLRVYNSTISGNIAYAGGGGIRNGEFSNTIRASANARISFSTITNNTANTLTGQTTEPRPRTGGGIQNFGTVTMDNTIVAGNRHCLECGDPRIPPADYSPECYSKPPAVFTSFRGNLVGPVTNNCNLQDFEGDGTPFDQVGVADPGFVMHEVIVGGLTRMEPFLTYNGGPTFLNTHALRPGSPAIDKANFCRGEIPHRVPFFETDQRGARRPAGMTCDVGAFEVGKPELIAMQRLQRSGFINDPGTKKTKQEVTYKNVSNSPISGNIFLVLDQLNTKPLLNRDGQAVAPPNSDYVIMDIGPDNVLNTDEETAKITLIFNNPPATQMVRYTPRFLAGTGMP